MTMASSSGSQSVEAAGATAATPLRKTYKWQGRTYVEKVKSAKGVNSGHTLDEILDHVAAFPPHVCAPKREVAHEVPHQSIDDYVNTLRQACSHGGPFRWPSDRYGFMRVVGVAFHHLPTGYMFSIKNAQEIPDDYYHKSGKLD